MYFNLKNDIELYEKEKKSSINKGSSKIKESKVKKNKKLDK